jgi:hypothetical protein
MKTMLYALVGLLIALVLGMAYVKFSGPAAELAAVAAPVVNPSNRPDWAMLIGFVVFSWVIVFLPLPRWLSVVLGLGIVFVGLAFMAVSGFVVALQYPNNTLADNDYVILLCSIAAVSSQVFAALRSISRHSDNGMP